MRNAWGTRVSLGPTIYKRVGHLISAVVSPRVLHDYFRRGYRHGHA